MTYLKRLVHNCAFSSAKNTCLLLQKPQRKASWSPCFASPILPPQNSFSSTCVRMPNKSTDVVLVTGASGYIAVHVVQQLLKAGYKVRGTVRSVKNETKIKPLKELCPEAKDNLELVEADLLNEASWKPAVNGCAYVMHIASPFVIGTVTDENELIKPAVDGTLNVLKACAATKGAVKRVVLTSSIASISYGHEHVPGQVKVYSEQDWTNPDGNIDPYTKSKVLAEKSAWDYIKDLPEEKFELCTINPGLVIGPMLHNSEGASAEIVKKIMTGGMPVVAKMKMGVIDVRDVARAHISAMETPEAAGNRFLTSLRSVWFKEFVAPLYAEFKPQGYSVPSMEAPNFLIKIGSFFDKTLKPIVPMCGVDFELNNSKMKDVLKLTDPIPMNKSVIEMVYNLIDRGFVPKAKKYTGPTTGGAASSNQQ